MLEDPKLTVAPLPDLVSAIYIQRNVVDKFTATAREVFVHGDILWERTRVRSRVAQTGVLKIPIGWAWAIHLAAAFGRLRALHPA